MKAFAKLCASTALAGLLLSCASVPAAGYGTMNFCTATTRILSHLNVSLESDLTNYQGIGCETDPGVRITLDATAAPNGFGITCELSDGTIGSGGAVFLTNPVGTDAALVAPLRVKIERNVFEADAVLYVLGSFPTSSSISIANNTFNVGYPNDLYSAVGTNFISAITFGDVDTEQLLFTNAQVLIYLNKINVEDRTGDPSNPLETYGIYMSSHVYLSQDSGLLMQRNNITGSSDKRSIGVYCPRYVFILGNSTLAQISDNTIGLTNGVSLQSPAVATADTCIAAAEFSRNRIRLTPVHASTNAMILGPVNLSMTSELDVSDNTIVNEVTNGAFTLSSRILFNGPCVARENSTARIWFNTMNTKGGSPQINFGGPVMLEAHGSLWVVGNQMVRQEALVLGLSPVAFFSVSLRGDSSLSISQNTFGSENSNSAPLMVALSDSGAYLREENSTIDMCYDVYFGSTFASDAALAAAVSSRLREGLTSLDQCPEAITSVAPSAATTLTTKNYGTTVPSNNGAPAAHGLSTPTLAVMVAALGAVLSVLYC